MGAGGIYRSMGRKCVFTAKVVMLLLQKRSLDVRFEKAIMTSRREFLSNALGTALLTASTWPIRAEARSMHGQSDSSTSKSPRTTQNTSLRWDVFLAPSIPAITSDLPPAEKQRPWPPISSTLISGARDAVLVDTPITVEQARALANWVVARHNVRFMSAKR